MTLTETRYFQEQQLFLGKLSCFSKLSLFLLSELEISKMRNV